MKTFFKILFLIYTINQIKTSDTWKISFYGEEDINHQNPNKFNLLRGNYQTIQVMVEKYDVYFPNAIIKLKTNTAKMMPNELKINARESGTYSFDVGIPCNTVAETMDIQFSLEDINNVVIDTIVCQGNAQLIPKVITFDILNYFGFSNNMFSKLYIKQDFKNYESLDIKVMTDRKCQIQKYLQEINNIEIGEYTKEEDLIIHYSWIRPNFDKIQISNKCEISLSLESTDNSKCFAVDNNRKINLEYKAPIADLDRRETFNHNSIVSSYIDNNINPQTGNLDDTSLSLHFYKEVDYFVSYCLIQDANDAFISNFEILNQRANSSNKKIFSSFAMTQFDIRDAETEIKFRNLEKNRNYKIKCIFDLFDNKTSIELTYGEDMQVPMKINFNETKMNLVNNCYTEEYMRSNNLDTRYCDIINRRLLFTIFPEVMKYKLSSFNFEDFSIYSTKNTEGKLEHIKNILNKNEEITTSNLNILSAMSDYLFVINCQENKECQDEKDKLFKNIITKYKEINLEKIDIKNEEQIVLNDILLFNNIIENTDCINYDNFDYLINSIAEQRNKFFIESIRVYNNYLSNYFVLIFDKFLTITTKFKTIYKNKFELDEKLNMYKNKVLIDFFNSFTNWISYGMVNSGESLQNFCKNLYINYSQDKDSVTIFDNNDILIKGFETEESKKLYKEIFSTGGISYKEFPLFPLSNHQSIAVTLILFTDLRENFVNEEIAYSEAFKIIFKQKTIDNYCYIWNNIYNGKDHKLINNYVLTEYLNEKDEKYDINCISNIMISPMTVILGQHDVNGSLFKEGIGFLSIIFIVLLTLSLIVVTSPFILDKYYKNQTKQAENALKELK